MLPVIPESKLKAHDFVDLVAKTTAPPDWMKNIFSSSGHDLQIATTYKYPKTAKPPAWFGTWHTAALSAWQANEWKLTTGTLQLLPNDLSEMIADGVSMGKQDPTGNWVDFPQIEGHDKGEGGITVPTKKVKADLNAQKDPKLHYGGVIVRLEETRGAIVVVDRFKVKGGQIVSRNANEIIEVLFHEMFHAGQISQGLANADADPRFKKIAQAIESYFLP